ncbi:MAG TPA: hypothetical protein VFD84_08460 [Candidatus Binatia bacterium]|jgi:hypothetical protein|nr:hypothetical protein [Candidatus Binatia bacterium]
MAHLTLDEFTAAVTALGRHFGFERVRDRLAHMNAFTSRRGLNDARALATRLHQLTGGLRRPVAGTYAFSALWNEMVSAGVGEEGEKKLEAIADRVNACLGPDETIVAGKEEDLDRALADYRETLAAATAPDVATIDMLLKAVPSVAQRLRAPAPPARPEPLA